MDINAMAQRFIQQVKNRDSNAEIKITATTIKGVQNSMLQPVVDVYVKTGGLEYNYCVLHDPFSGRLVSMPIINK